MTEETTPILGNDHGDGGGTIVRSRRSPFYRAVGVILGSLALLFVGFLAVGFLLPNGWSATRSLRLDAEPSTVFQLVSGAEAWGAWTPSPATGVELFGPAEGPGSGRRWDDPLYGKGEFVVATMIAPREVGYDVSVEDGAIRIRGHIEIEPDGSGSIVRWREDGDFGWNPLLGYLSRRMNDLQGAQMEASLVALRALLEAEPRPDPGVTAADSTTSARD